MSERHNGYGQPIGVPVPEWSARARPERVPLQGRYCRLEPVDVERHAAELQEAYAAAPDDRDWTYLFLERPATPEQMRTYLTRLAESADPLHFAIVDAAAGKAVGTAALMRIDPTHGVMEVGSIAYSAHMKRTRAGTEAMYLMMRYAFDGLGYRRYEWKCDSLNAPSRAAAARYGFAFEGIFRKAIVYKGRNRDTAWYSIVDDEWPWVRAAFEAWLDPVNFGEQGRQKRSLSAFRGPALVPATHDHLLQMMPWFPTRESCVRWGGPAFRFPFDESSFREDTKVAELASFALVDAAGGLLGFGQYYAREGRCHLGRLVIHPDRRGQGLGTRLISSLATLGSEELRARECSLFVSTGNENAERLYGRLGFVRAPYPGGEPIPQSHYMVAPVKALSATA